MAWEGGGGENKCGLEGWKEDGKSTSWEGMPMPCPERSGGLGMGQREGGDANTNTPRLAARCERTGPSAQRAGQFLYFSQALLIIDVVKLQCELHPKLRTQGGRGKRVVEDTAGQKHKLKHNGKSALAQEGKRIRHSPNHICLKERLLPGE